MALSSHPLLLLALYASLGGTLGCELLAGLEERALSSMNDAGGGGGDDGGATSVGGMGGAPIVSRWPDSLSVFCTDGDTGVDPCPEPGFAGYGQDGNYLLQVPSYTFIGDIARDTVTGLEWAPNDQPFDDRDWQGALDHCDNLQLEGRRWRLPSRLELASLIDAGGSPPLDLVASNFFWSSSPYDATSAWALSLSDVAVWPIDIDETWKVVCVTGAPLSASYQLEGEVVRDSVTGLTWAVQPEGGVDDWSTALSRCEGKADASHDDWRLPSVKEWVTLFQDDGSAIPGVEGSGEFWTSSPNFSGDAAYVGAIPAAVGSNVTFIGGEVRCVRGPD
jgi:hypothetical protein